MNDGIAGIAVRRVEPGFFASKALSPVILRPGKEDGILDGVRPQMVHGQCLQASVA